MAKLGPNHLIYWFGNTSYPAGFSRYAPSPALDVDRFLAGAGAGGVGEEPGGTGGADTHTHTLAIHQHSAVGTHTHSYSGASSTHGTEGTQPATGTPQDNMVQLTHAHPSATSGSSNPETTSNAGPTVTSASSSGACNPPYVEAVLLQPATDGTDVPVGGVVLYDGASPPDGFANCDANNHATPDIDLSEKFIRILDNGTNPTGTPGTGGSIAGHTHVVADHAHTTIGHSHTWDSTTTNDVALANPGTTQALTGYTSPDHHHGMVATFTGGTLADSGITATNTGDTTSGNSPKHIRLAAVKKLTSVGISDGIIVVYIGTRAQLAALSDWRFCDGTNGTPDMRSTSSVNRCWIKCAFSNVGSKEGTDTHAHGYSTHTHTASTHSHDMSADSNPATANHRISIGSGGFTRGPAGDRHLHNEHTWTVDSVETLYSNAGGQTSSSTDDRPPFLEVIFAKYLAPSIRILGGTILGGQIGS